MLLKVLGVLALRWLHFHDLYRYLSFMMIPKREYFRCHHQCGLNHFKFHTIQSLSNWWWIEWDIVFVFVERLNECNGLIWSAWRVTCDIMTCHAKAKWFCDFCLKLKFKIIMLVTSLGQMLVTCWVTIRYWVRYACATVNKIMQTIVQLFVTQTQTYRN